MQALISLLGPLDEALRNDDTEEVINIFDRGAIEFGQLSLYIQNKELLNEISAIIDGNHKVVEQMKASGKLSAADGFLKGIGGSLSKIMTNLMDDVVSILF